MNRPVRALVLLCALMVGFTMASTWAFKAPIFLVAGAILTVQSILLENKLDDYLISELIKN